MNRLKKTIGYSVAALAVVLCGCDNSHKDAQALMDKIHQKYTTGQYQEAICSIDSLRKKYPKEIELRKEALKVYQEAALKMAQRNLEKADSALLTMTANYEKQKAEVEAKKNKGIATAEELSGVTTMKIKLDSVKARFDAEVARVKFIHKKQAED